MQNPSEEDRATYETLINNFLRTLGCGKCVHHAFQHLEQHPLPLDGRQALFEWTVNFHNVVNARLGKQEMPLDRAILKYSCNDSGVVSPPPSQTPVPVPRDSNSTPATVQTAASTDIALLDATKWYATIEILLLGAIVAMLLFRLVRS